MKQYIRTVFLTTLLLGQVSLAAEKFTVSNVEIVGNDHVDRQTVMQYSTVKIGDEISSVKIAKIIKSLYHSGLFTNVSVARHGNVLVIQVAERQIIGSISYSGNSLIPKDRIDGVLKQVGLVRGLVYNSGVMERVEKSLKASYVEQGYYNAEIETSVKPQPRNRVDVVITIREDKSTQVKEIKIIGNKAFTQKQLTSDFELTTPKLWSFLTGGDKYNKQKLEQDVEKVRQYYLDHGYLQVKIDSAQTTVSEDRRFAYVVIHITEGAQFRLTGYQLAGQLLGAEAEVQRLIDLPLNAVYSQKLVTVAEKSIADYYGDRGYAFTRIQLIPEFDEQHNTLKVKFFVTPGRRIYVRRIMFTGNEKTSDNVLRREIRQMEAAPFSNSAIESSLRNLRVLGYLKDVNMNLQPIQGSDDQVDTMISVKELPSSTAAISGGYGSNGVGLVLGAKLNQQNFLGTGNYIGVNFERDQSHRSYTFDYVNPYYTQYGVSRGFQLFSQRTSPSNIGLASYAFDNYGGTINFRVPISDFTGFNVGFGPERVKLHTYVKSPVELTNFIAANGSEFNHVNLTFGWDNKTYDQDPFMTRGINQKITALVSYSMGKNPLDFYKIDYNAHWYHPLTKQFIFSLSGNLGYGNSYGRLRGGLPIFENYLAGGLDSVRGFDAGSLGPRSSSIDSPIGGNAVVVGSASIIVPNGISENLRTSLFLDAGNVYNTRLNTVNVGQLKYSTGIAAEWRVQMLGVIRFSVAKPLNTRNGDRPRIFDFGFGTQF